MTQNKSEEMNDRNKWIASSIKELYKKWRMEILACPRTGIYSVPALVMLTAVKR